MFEEQHRNIIIFVNHSVYFKGHMALNISTFLLKFWRLKVMEKTANCAV